MINKTVTWCKIIDGYYKDVIQTSGDRPIGDNWIECPERVINYKNKKREWFDNDHNPIEETILIKKGIRKDNRGTWFNKENREDSIQIVELDETVNDNYTKEVPLENEHFQFFDKQKNKWVADTEKKERAEKEHELNLIQNQIKEAEEKTKRPSRAIIRNRVIFEKYLAVDNMEETEKDNFLKSIDNELKKDFDYYIQLDDLIKDDLRPKYKRLEAELKSV